MSVRYSQCAECRRPSQALASYCGVECCAACLASRCAEHATRVAELEARVRDQMMLLAHEAHTDGRVFAVLHGGEGITGHEAAKIEAVARRHAEAALAPRAAENESEVRDAE